MIWTRAGINRPNRTRTKKFSRPADRTGAGGPLIPGLVGNSELKKVRMKLSGAFLIAAAQATPQPCGPRLEMSGLSGTFADLNGLWTFAMDGNGNVLQNQQKPYYKRVGGDDFMWWMWHGNTGHWVVNKTPGKDSNT